jgi:hypothetical protein
MDYTGILADLIMNTCKDTEDMARILFFLAELMDQTGH